MSKSATQQRRDSSTENDGRSRVLIVTSVPEHDEVAELAYQLWILRGCPDGSPEEDWFRAEEALLRA
jgi:hypothetical protein